MNYSYFFAAILLLCAACQRKPRPANNEVAVQPEIVVTDVAATSKPEAGQDLKPGVSLRRDTTRKWVPTQFQGDTLIGDTRVTYCVYGEDKEFEPDEVADRFLILSVAHKGRCIVNEREILKTDFDSIIGPDWLPRVELYNCFPGVPDEGQIATVGLGLFKPDSDLGGWISLSVDSLGRLSAYAIEDEYDDED